MLNRETTELIRDLRGRPDVARLLTEPDLSPGTAPIVDLHFDVAGTSFRFFSVVSTIGAPIDVTAQELRVEAFFPADDEPRDRWTWLAVNEPPQIRSRRPGPSRRSRTRLRQPGMCPRRFVPGP